MSKQSAITCSKSAKETQKEAVKQAQSQQYRHQRHILDITLLPPPSMLYLFHSPLQSPLFDFKQTNTDIVVIFLALEFKENLRILTVNQTFTVKPNLHILNLTVTSSWFPFSNFVFNIFKSFQIFHLHWYHLPNI